MKRQLQKILRFLTAKVLKKYRPRVIGVTGSVGKTSTKEAIYTVLKSKFKVRKSRENYNNEIGVPLAVLGCESAGKSFWGWLKIIFKGIKLSLFKDKKYPDILVLEMAADRPGDLKYLVSMAPCQIGVVTAVGPSHLEFFKTLENTVKEKRIMVSHLPDEGWAILNGDDAAVYSMKEKTEAKILTFGFSEEADVRATEINISKETDIEDLKDKIKGVSFKINYKGNIVPVFLPKVLGKQHVCAALAATAVGLAIEMNLVEISEALKEYRATPGRMRLLGGIKHTLIIDDTYNASPVSVKAALDALAEIPVTEGNKIVALGEMLELGDFTEVGHKEVGIAAAGSGADILITVGEKARDIARGAKEKGMPESDIFSFADSEEAGKFIQDRLKHGDLVLSKGSQRIRMEKIVKELMAEPLKAGELLVRQSEDWLRK